MKGDIAMAIADYSQAIRFKPQDDDMYFRRAEMYEKSSETLLAMEDYAKVSCPLHTEMRLSSSAFEVFFLSSASIASALKNNFLLFLS